MKPETKFRRNVVTPFLNTLKNTAKFPIQQLALRGHPDFILCIHGRFVALELKDVGEAPRKLQEYMLSNVTRTKGVRIVADKENWEQVSKILSFMDLKQENAWKTQSHLNLSTKTS